MDEASVIVRHFVPLGGADPAVRVGIGDDGAVLAPPVGEELVLTTDALLEGVHLPADAPAESWGRRLAAVNLSDLGAMGARPRWALLALALPEAREDWLAGFARGLGEGLAAAGVSLVGGNLTRGPRNLALTLLGTVPAGRVLTRRDGRPGDAVLVTGRLGAAALARRRWFAGERETEAVRAYLEPDPPWRLGSLLSGHATAAIDLSDGFLADLSRLLAASAVGAVIDLDALPLAPGLDPRDEGDLRLALAGGDDYELCFTAPGPALATVADLARGLGRPLARVGTLVEGSGLRLRRGGNDVTPPVFGGYDHFRPPP